MATRKKAPKRSQKGGSLWRGGLVSFCIGFVVLIGGLVYNEIITSEAQAKWFSHYTQKVSFAMEPGSNPAMHYPLWGPYNARLGYQYLPFYTKALAAEDFSVAAQMRGSAMYNTLIGLGLYPPYYPKTTAGLTLYDREGKKLYAASYPQKVFSDFSAIPPLLVQTLLYIENRELLQDGPVTRNPVIEWGRLCYATWGRLARLFDPRLRVGGGSTLATQIEKFRFSPSGQTTGVGEKLRQIFSASLRVYLDGPDTRKARETIVLDYLNSTPLSARPGFGEINSFGDGLWAWFGLDLDVASILLTLPEEKGDALQSKAFAYRAALGLILAQRRPSEYLLSNHTSLDRLIDMTLDRLRDEGVVSQALCDAAKKTKLVFLKEPPTQPPPAYVDQKAVNALRVHLMNSLGLKNLYEVDRLDLSGQTTIDRSAQENVAALLKKMEDIDFLKSQGFYGHHLLEQGDDPTKIKWSVVLYERGEKSNKVRVQVDTIEGPFDMNEGMKLDLGSTAKLRTLVTYLEIVAELHRRYAGLDAATLKDMASDAPDALTEWAVTWLRHHVSADLETMLRASLKRRYSASPNEVFFTGSGAHVFHNFERDEDSWVMPVREAFCQSVNLIFIRMMRDIVNYTIAQRAQTKEALLEAEGGPERQAYLERFADQEGRVFLNRYVAEYEGLSAEARLDKLLEQGHQSAVARTVMFRSIHPKADYKTYQDFMKAHGSTLSLRGLAELYTAYAPGRYSLADRAYLVGVNPMKLWLLAYWQENPHATHRDLIKVSRPVRIACYAWLYKPGKKQAQDKRIRIMLEKDAFNHIQKRWARLGYPFDLVPSYATAIGSSADRPGSLAALMGIILSDGVRKPAERFESLEFGTNTPYQTLFRLNGKPPRQVLSPVVARVIKDVMTDIVENGTARRLRGVYKDAQGRDLRIGGKTGTGDQRYDEFSSNGKLMSSRVVNRTGTFVFYIGDRFFGAITAHVAGEEAGRFTFTSSLATQLLKVLAPALNPLIDGAPAALAP
ncbi:MAG: transglycosylase domain-containing protein [Alphaproteobacteria bacterium]|nr:transglycosylase domain-containing protein [Alphaproteobacteria bacterium]